MAEHKALMERFAAAAMAAQTAAAASAASSAASSPVKEAEIKAEISASPPASPKTPSAGAPTRESSHAPQNMPIDLSNKRSSDEEDSAEETEMEIEINQSKKKFKDLNRNVLFTPHTMANLAKTTSSGSEADEEEDEELDVAGDLR